MSRSKPSKSRTFWTIVLMPGYLIGGIKLLCITVWFFYQPIAAMLGLTEEKFSLAQYAETVVVGLVGAGLAVVAWPVAIYMVISGAMPLGELLFFPWAGAQ